MDGRHEDRYQGLKTMQDASRPEQYRALHTSQDIKRPDLEYQRRETKNEGEIT